MSEICPKCGLPKELCICETIAKEAQRIKIAVVKRKFGKMITTISGISDKNIDIKDLTKKLKSKLACGGTSKETTIELQGNHLQKAKQYLIELGFPEESIRITKKT